MTRMKTELTVKVLAGLVDAELAAKALRAGRQLDVADMATMAMQSFRQVHIENAAHARVEAGTLEEQRAATHVRSYPVVPLSGKALDWAVEDDLANIDAELEAAARPPPRVTDAVLKERPYSRSPLRLDVLYGWRQP